MRLALLLSAHPAFSQTTKISSLPDAPSSAEAATGSAQRPGVPAVATVLSPAADLPDQQHPDQQHSSSAPGGPATQAQGSHRPAGGGGEVDAQGNAVPVSRTQPKRILGLMPNYRSVSGGAVAERPTAKRNFAIANRQALDYSSFIFLGITSMSAEGLDEHPSLGKGVPGFWGYTWRGFLDKTDNTYQSAFLFPTLLHEDGRYYAMGAGGKWKRLAYASSRVVVTRTYSGRNTFNFAGIGGKVGAQAVSRTYYPGSASTFGALATKFGYSVARDVGFTVFRESYPDIATHVLHRNP